MKLVVLGVIALSLSVSAATGTQSWSIKDSTENLDLKVSTVQYGDQNYNGFVNGTRCISGNLKAAFKELNVQEGLETQIQKERVNRSGIVLKVKGPVCTRYENGTHPDNPGECVERKVRSRLVSFKACDESRKYFSPYKSPKVDFTQTVLLKLDPNSPNFPNEGSSEYVDKFFGGSIQLEMRASVAYLDITFKSWQYGTEGSNLDRAYRNLRLVYSPDSISGEEIRFVDTFSDFGKTTKCSVMTVGDHYVVTCDVDSNVLGNIYLPKWAFSQISADTRFVPASIGVPGYSIRKSPDSSSLVAGKDFFSMSELWENLYSAGQVKGCIEYSVVNMYSLPSDLLNCNTACGRSITGNGNAIDFIHQDPNTGFSIHRTQTTCIKSDNDANNGSGVCLESKKTANTVQIPFCS